MRRLIVGMVVAAATVLTPVWAMAGNQEVAENIAASLRESGQLKGYKIGVKYQDGTAWLRGRVTSLEQMNTALKLAFQAPGVTRVVNELNVGSGDQPAKSTELAVRQVSGAVKPERIARLGPASRGAQSQPVQVDPDAAIEAEPRKSNLVQRVAATFSKAPAKQVAATVPQQTAPAQPSALPGRPMPVAYVQGGAPMPIGQVSGGPIPQYAMPVGGGAAQARYDQPNMPNYTWPSYAAHPNYAALTYPKQYSPTAWPYIGPFYPYPQVPLGWRKVTLEWHDGWWQLDFDDGPRRGCFSGLFRPSH
jgi:hypothetical protein